MQPDQDNQTILATSLDTQTDDPGMNIPVNVLSGIPPESSLEPLNSTPVNTATSGVAQELPNNPVITAQQAPLQSVKPRLFQRFLPKGRLPRIALASLISVTALVVILTMITRQPATSNQPTDHKAAGVLSSITVTPMNTSGENVTINRDTIIGAKKSFTALGVARFQSVYNSPTAFEIQNASGGSLFNADTANNKVQVNGSIVASGSVVVGNGVIDISAAGIKIGGVLVCTSAGCITGPASSGNGGGSTSNSQKAICDYGLCVSLQTKGTGITEKGSINISGQVSAGEFSGNGAGLTSVDALTLQGLPADYFTNADNISAGVISDQRLSGNVALLNRDQSFSGNNIFNGPSTFTNTIVVRNSTDSSQALNIQNAAGVSLLNINTLAGEVELGQSGIQTGDLSFLGSSNNNRITIHGLDGPSSNQNIYLPDMSGTICLTSGNCT